MKKFIAACKEDPMLTLAVGITVATTVAAVMTGSAKLIEASAYAHRASKMK